MSAHYTWNEGVPLGMKLREGLDDLRNARHKLKWILGAMSQMSDAQIASVFGFTDDEVAAAAKAELQADVGKFLAGDAVDAALQQMLDQFA